jgi:hypothetical protein
MTNTVQHLHDRMKYLLQKTVFANKLEELICALGLPERAYSTFVRAAQSFQAFKRITFHLRLSDASSKQAHLCSSSMTASITTTPPKFMVKSSTKHVEVGRPDVSATSLQTSMKTTAIGTPSLWLQRRPQPQKAHLELQQPDDASQPMSEPNQQNDVVKILQPYLTEEDLLRGLTCLQSASKKHAVDLLAAVLRRQLLPTSASAWYVFGFVFARNNEEGRHLAGLYRAILLEVKDKMFIFREITRALESNILVRLFDVK